MTRDEWDKLTSDEQFEFMSLSEKRDEALRSLLQMVPCPEHGECVPHLREWITQQLALIKESRRIEGLPPSVVHPANADEAAKMIEEVWNKRYR